MIAQVDATSRIVELLAYTGTGAVVGSVLGLATRRVYEEMWRASRRIERDARKASLAADEARDMAFAAQEEAHPKG